MLPVAGGLAALMIIYGLWRNWDGLINATIMVVVLIGGSFVFPGLRHPLAVMIPVAAAYLLPLAPATARLGRVTQLALALAPMGTAVLFWFAVVFWESLLR